MNFLVSVLLIPVAALTGMLWGIGITEVMHRASPHLQLRGDAPLSGTVGFVLGVLCGVPMAVTGGPAGAMLSVAYAAISTGLIMSFLYSLSWLFDKLLTLVIRCLP